LKVLQSYSNSLVVELPIVLEGVEVDTCQECCVKKWKSRALYGYVVDLSGPELGRGLLHHTYGGIDFILDDSVGEGEKTGIALEGEAFLRLYDCEGKAMVAPKQLLLEVATALVYVGKPSSAIPAAKSIARTFLLGDGWGELA
jgi:hypothetical protein